MAILNAVWNLSGETYADVDGDALFTELARLGEETDDLAVYDAMRVLKEEGYLSYAAAGGMNARASGLIRLNERGRAAVKPPTSTPVHRRDLPPEPALEICGHCGTRASLVSVGDHVIERGTQSVDGYGEMDWATVWRLLRCTRCEHATLMTAAWSDDVGDYLYEERVFPPERDDSAIPPDVLRQLDHARRLRHVDPSSYAVAVRRTIEAICLDKGVVGRNLEKKIDSLVDRELLPKEVAELAHQLRYFGNFGAHVDDVEVRTDDVPFIEGFADSVLEYVYRAPAKLDSVKASIEARKQHDAKR